MTIVMSSVMWSVGLWRSVWNQRLSPGTDEPIAPTGVTAAIGGEGIIDAGHSHTTARYKYLPRVCSAFKNQNCQTLFRRNDCRCVLRVFTYLLSWFGP